MHSGKSTRNLKHMPYAVSSESCNVFVFVLSGTGIHDVNGCRRALTPGTMEIIPPYMHQVIENNSNIPLELIYIYFDLFETDSPVSHKEKNRPLSSNEMYFADKCCYKISTKHITRATELCKQIAEAPKATDTYQHLLQKQRLLELITLFLDEKEIAEENSLHLQKDYVFRAMQYIEFHYGDATLCAKNVAKYLDLSTDYLSKLFKSQTHTTLSEYIRFLRIARAKELLYIDNSITSVATKCGFSSVQSFCRTFKSIEHSTPGELIKER